MPQAETESQAYRDHLIVLGKMTPEENDSINASAATPAEPPAEKPPVPAEEKPRQTIVGPEAGNDEAAEPATETDAPESEAPVPVDPKEEELQKNIKMAREILVRKHKWDEDTFHDMLKANPDRLFKLASTSKEQQDRVTKRLSESAERQRALQKELDEAREQGYIHSQGIAKTDPPAPNGQEGEGATPDSLEDYDPDIAKIVNRKISEVVKAKTEELQSLQKQLAALQGTYVRDRFDSVLASLESKYPKLADPDIRNAVFSRAAKLENTGSYHDEEGRLRMADLAGDAAMLLLREDNSQRDAEFKRQINGAVSPVAGSKTVVAKPMSSEEWHLRYIELVNAGKDQEARNLPKPS